MSKFYESDYEEALIELLVGQGWTYLFGGDVQRAELSKVLLVDELSHYLLQAYPELKDEDIEFIINKLRHVEGGELFERLRKTYYLLRDGFRYERSSDGKHFDIAYINFDEPQANRFHCLNQYRIAYGSEGDTRVPDILLFLNGIPLCIMELKNPADERATIADAYEQIHTRYRRDIAHLLRYCPLSVISDGTNENTKLGTIFTPYEHYYVWKKVNNEDKPAQSGLEQVKALIEGVFSPTRLLEILRDYLYFPDDKYAREELVVCRYPQFFATRMLRASVLEAFRRGDNKGGTYFGATGCGKTYTMMFLARQLALRCPELGSPTIVMLVDREDLQSQAGKLFLRSETYLSGGVIKVIDSREELKREMGSRETGGFFICTVQKFCEAIGELNTRKNIICFSDEAHRSQVRINSQLKVKEHLEEGEGSEALGAFITKPYAELIRTAFPEATFVGFTGTPIAETIQVFGEVVDSYTMKQAVADGITLDLKYIPRVAKVTLDSDKVKEIDSYYTKCYEEGASEEDIQESKRAMSAMSIILGDDDRLERLAGDIYAHYSSARANRADVVEKAMIVCSKRDIAYRLLKKFEIIAPEWFVERKSPDDSLITDPNILNSLSPMPTIAMVATRGSNDPKDMYDYLGNKERIKMLDNAFKMEQSNFRIVIVVDMWITGFDVPCLTYLYNDKPLQKQTLIQTISRVNRKYAGKEFGYIIDYIGIQKRMMEAMKHFGGDNFGPSEDDVQQALQVLKTELSLISTQFQGFDISPFYSSEATALQRYECLSRAANYILSKPNVLYTEAKANQKPKAVSEKDYFLAHIKILRSAYEVCQPSAVLDAKELALSQCFMAVASYLRKTGNDKHDTESMNRAVKRMVEEALQCDSVVNILNIDIEDNIFSPDFVARLNGIKMPATKLEVLVKMLRQAIKSYKKTNKVSAEKYEDLLRKVIDSYHERKTALSSEEATQTQQEAVELIIKEATQQAIEILKDLGKDKESFRELDLSFEEKAFYDILIHLRNQHQFEYGVDRELNGLIINDKCKALAKKIKSLIDEQSAFSDWLNNANIRSSLKQQIILCLMKNAYPPKFTNEVFNQVMEQVENFKLHEGDRE